MTLKKNNHIQRIGNFASEWAIWILGGVLLFIGAFCYYRIFVHTEYIHFAQQPVFFAERRFFMENMRMPGGLLDILAACLTDLYMNGWLGAILLAGFVFITFLLLTSVMHNDVWWIAPVIPAILLFMAQAKYEYPASKTLSLMLALSVFILYRDFLPQQGRFRFLITILLILFVYILSPGAMLLLVLLCILYETLNSSESILKQLLIFWGFSAAAILLPLIASHMVPFHPVREYYLRHTLIWSGDGIKPLKVLPEVILGLLILAGILFTRNISQKKGDRHMYRISLLQVPVAIIFLTAGAWMAVDREQKQVLAIRSAAHGGDWYQVTKHINSHTVENPLCLFHFNRAYFHLGKMGSNIFNLPQNFGRYGLFLHTDLSFQYPLDCSDFFFELGNINAAERWACEALTIYGESPDVLKRLVLINIVQDDSIAAVEYLQRLRQNPYSHSWADRYLSNLARPEKLYGNPLLQKLHALTLKSDFIITSDHPETDLQKMLEQAPANRMAFEYLVTYCMITRDLDGFKKNLFRFRSFTETEMPRHYEEALIAYHALKKPTDDTASFTAVRKTTIDRFADFERILLKYNGDTKAAEADLSRSYADTYWFYILYARPVL